MPQADNGVLLRALEELAPLGTDQDRERIAAVKDRLDAARLRVLVAGEAKRGKSTLINALLSRDVLPTGVTPLTAVATTVRYGDDPHATARYEDGHEEKHALAALPDLVTERGNPGNRRRIRDVTVYLDTPLLASGLELVDTPGTGSVFDWDTRAAHEALNTMDAAVFVLSADPPVSADERDLYRKVAALSVTTFTVLNKADHLDNASLTEAMAFTGRVIAGSAGKDGEGCVYAMSAKAALESCDPGFDAFLADFTSYLASRRTADLQASAIGQACRIAHAILDDIALTRLAAEMRAGDAAQKVAEFGERLAEVAVRGRDAVVVVNAESSRTLFAMNDAAAEDERSAGRDVTARLNAFIGGELRTAPPGEIERRGRERLVELTVAEAGAWREQWHQRIEDVLAKTDARLAADLARALGVLRDSAAELLGLELSVPALDGRLVENQRFFYSTAEDVGQTELLAGAIRRALPGDFGRRRAREYLRREAPDLVAAQIGRARGDLQYRLSEATRTMARMVELRYADATGRMQAALAAAADIDSASAAEAAQIQYYLAERSVVIHHVLALLDAVSTQE
ncbi:MAG: dynamin family protein [Trebonia sp.]